MKWIVAGVVALPIVGLGGIMALSAITQANPDFFSKAWINLRGRQDWYNYIFEPIGSNRLQLSCHKGILFVRNGEAYGLEYVREVEMEKCEYQRVAHKSIFSRCLPVSPTVLECPEDFYLAFLEATKTLEGEQ